MTMLLPLVGFVLLAAGTYRQSQMLFGALPSAGRRRMLLGAGLACLLLSLVHRLGAPHASLQIVRWFGDLSLAALVVVVALWLRTLPAARTRRSPSRAVEAVRQAQPAERVRPTG